MKARNSTSTGGYVTRTDLERVDRHVGAQLRRFRRRRGLSQASLAMQLGLAHQQIHNLEIARTRCTSELLHRLSCILEVSLSDFFDGLGEGIDHADAGSDERMIRAIVDPYSRIDRQNVRLAFVRVVVSIADRVDKQPSTARSRKE